MTTLVTGGAGFIGANFGLAWLEAEGTPVINVDKLTYAGNLRNLESIKDDPRHQFVRGDICDYDQVAGLLPHCDAEFARWNGSLHACAFMGGRVALSACVHGLQLRPGDEVILPDYISVLVPNALQYPGLRPVYCDIELETYGIDAARVEAAITPRTRAVLLHHLYGVVCRDYSALLDLAEHHGLAVIEDRVHATSAGYRGVEVGNAGAFAFYSSEQTKLFSRIQGRVAVTKASPSRTGYVTTGSRLLETINDC